MNAKNIITILIIITFVILGFTLKQRADYIEEIKYQNKIKNDTSSTSTKREESKQVKTEATKISNKTYVVQKGDTLWDIAEKTYGSGFEYHKIIEKNPGKTFKFVNGNEGLIYPGKELNL